MAIEIDRESWGELSVLLDEALERPVADRAAWLDTLHPRHEVLKPRLRELLERAGDVESGDFLRDLPPVDHERPAASGAAGACVGPYRLLRELGAGGMGSVWLAERTDGLLKRPVALKLPHLAGRRTDLAERMEREREILAALRHPHIATLYDAGVGADGQPYLALEYVEGRPIDQFCRERNLASRERVALFLQVVHAVAHAHAKLVVHRDLKPSNVLVSEDGQSHLLDFGIAKILENGRTRVSSLTEFGGNALTPEYASPEQIRGDPVTIASDVYSLGVILYELLAGARPYRPRHESRGALEDSILQAEPRRPSDVAGQRDARTLRGDLDTIVLKALKKSPAERYATANAFADDLQRYLEQRPVLARPDGVAYRLRRFAARNRLPVAVAGVVAVLAIAGAASYVHQARVAVRERDRAEVVRSFLESVLRDADPYARAGGVLTAQELLVHAGDTIGGRFADQPEIRVELENLVGASLANLGGTDEARVALVRAVGAATSSLGSEHPLTIQARATLANVDVLVRDATAAERALRELLPHARRLADEHPAILMQVLRVQADLAFLQGRYQDTEAPAREAFAVARRAFGDRHPDTVAASSLLAESAVFRRESPESVLAATARGLEFALAAHGDSTPHAQVIHMRGIRARSLPGIGYFHEAAIQMDRVIADADALFGGDNRLSAEARLHAAPVHARIGSLPRALEYADGAVSHYSRTVEPRSADRAVTQLGRGLILIAARRPEQAEIDLAAAESTYALLFGATHARTRNVSGNRARALALLGRFDAAHEALRRMHGAGLDEMIPERMVPPYFVGSVRRLQGDADGAAAALEQALAVVRPGPRGDWDRVRVRAELGLAELDRGRLDAARVHLRAADELYAKLDVTMHPAVADVLVGLGSIEASAGACQRALVPLQRADAYWREFDRANAAGGPAAWWLAHCQRRLGSSDAADASERRARRLLAASPLPGDRALARLTP